MMTVENETRPLNILLAVDGSEHSYAAASLLKELPLSPGSIITAVAVLIPREASKHAILEMALKQTQNILQESGFTVEVKLLPGFPSEVLSEYADQHRPDLIALGAKGIRATLGILLGGVAQQLVEYAHCPVLITRAPYTGIQRVVLVTDGSASSERAVEYLGRFPLPREVDLQVLHVLPPLPTPDLISRSWPYGSEVVPPMPTPDMDEVINRQAAEEEREGKVLLANTAEMLKQAGITAGGVLLRGDAATEIIAYAKGHQVDLIIAGSRGLSRVRSWLLGSVSRKLVHYAGCSIMIVKG